MEQQLLRHTPSILLRHHRTRPTRVRQRRPNAPRRIHLIDDIRITRVLGSRRLLHKLILLELRPLPHGAQETHARRHDGLVNGVAESVVQHLGGTRGVSRVDGDGAAGEGLLEADEDALAAGSDGVLDDGSVFVLEEVGEDLALGFDACEELLAAGVDGGEVRGVFLGLDLLGEGGVAVGCDLGEGDHGEGVTAALGEGSRLVGVVLSPGGGVEGGVRG